MIRLRRLWTRLGVLAFFIMLAAASAAQAIVLAPSQKERDALAAENGGPDGGEDAEYYPQSAFGVPPEDPERLEIARDKRFQSRRPAGLVKQEADQQSLTAPKVKEPDALKDLVFDQKNASQEVSVIATDLGFKPKTIFASRDVPLRLYITGASPNTLCFMLDQFRIKRQVRSSKVEEIQLTPSAPGFYRFYCPINNLEGTLVVKDSATATATPTVRPE